MCLQVFLRYVLLGLLLAGLLGSGRHANGFLSRCLNYELRRIGTHGSSTPSAQARARAVGSATLGTARKRVKVGQLLRGCPGRRHLEGRRDLLEGGWIQPTSLGPRSCRLRFGPSRRWPGWRLVLGRRLRSRTRPDLDGRRTRPGAACHGL